jgi:hypothetical protein
VHDQTPALRGSSEEERRGAASSEEVGADACREHPIPAPERLFPERQVEEGHVGFAVLLVAAPDVVHEQVEMTALPLHLREKRCDLLVDGVVAADRHTNTPTRLDELGCLVDRAARARRGPAMDAAAGDIDRCSRLTEHERDTAPSTPARTRHDAHYSAKIEARFGWRRFHMSRPAVSSESPVRVPPWAAE